MPATYSIPNTYPCTREEALCRARSVVGKGGQYLLGTGDYRPYSVDIPNRLPVVVDLPWTQKGFQDGSDCAGFAICWAWKLERHRAGFNRGVWASVSDDINCNSALEDSQHDQVLFTAPAGPSPGDLLLYPTFSIKKADGRMLRFIGHVGLVEAVPVGWKAADGWTPLTILQCHGPNGFKPGVVRTDGSVFQHHDVNWPREAHRCHLVSVKERK